jgi:galactokinase
MDLYITGNIPQGAGLSVSHTSPRSPQSSAAFVVSVVLSFLVGAGKLDGFTKGDIVALALASEHRMGLRNGGLDVSRPRHR